MRTSTTLPIALVFLSASAFAQSPQQGEHHDTPAAAEDRGATGYVRLRVANMAGNLSDEALVIFHTGSPVTDGDDVLKYNFSHPTAPRIATSGDGTVLLAINAYGPYTTDVSIPVLIKVATNGTYTLTMTGLDGVGLTCLTLEDLVAGTTTPLHEGTVYTFDALANAPVDQARFMLHGTAPIRMELNAPTCTGAVDGIAFVELVTATGDVTWYTATGDEMDHASGAEGGMVHGPQVPAGEYGVRIEGTTACGSLFTAFELTDPAPLAVEVSVQQPLCAEDEGTVSVDVVGGTGSYNFNWSNGSSESNLNIPAGSYMVSVTDGNGCAAPSVPVEVEAGTSPEAIMDVDQRTISLGEAVQPISGSDPELDHTWDFGDGTTSMELAPEHTYAQPGTYELSLTVTDGNCSGTTTVTITVDSSTGLAAHKSGGSAKAWYGNGSILVEHSFSNALPVEVRVLNATGQLVHEARYRATPGRVSVTNAPLTPGVWFVQVGNGSTQRTFRVPVGM